MNKFLLSMACLLAIAGTKQSQVSAATLTVAENNASTLSNSDVNDLWRTKTISVKGGGQAPDVVTLLKAFHQALPTWAVGKVLKQNDHPAKGTRRDGTALIHESLDDYRILIDLRNGYVDLASQTDIDQMEACVWRRSNGHRIFAVSLYEQHDPVQHLLCWYDYDPKTETMKAERSPIDNYQKPFKNMDFGWTLPMKGTDFEIHEYYPSLMPIVNRIYKWDGSQHHYDHAQLSDFRYQDFAEGEWQQASGQGFKQFALASLDGNANPVLCLRKSLEPSEQEMVVFSSFKSDMQTVAINDEVNSINGFYRVKPEDDAPWTADDIVAYTSDFEHTHYFAVLQEGRIGYYAIDEPNYDDEGNQLGYMPRIIGYGSKDESIHIIHASIAEKLTLTPNWEKIEWVEEEP